LLGSGGAMATLRFEETQTFTWDPVTGTACVRSVPALVSPRSESFNTEVAVYVSPDVDRPDTACAMRAVIKVTASGTWALQPVVEKLMETRASASFGMHPIRRATGIRQFRGIRPAYRSGLCVWHAQKRQPSCAWRSDSPQGGGT
jgi:hypothetical protein